MTTRRGFISAMLAASMAPAYVKAGILMPVRQIWAPQSPLFFAQSELSEDIWTQGGAYLFPEAETSLEIVSSIDNLEWTPPAGVLRIRAPNRYIRRT